MEFTEPVLQSFSRAKDIVYAAILLAAAILSGWQFLRWYASKSRGQEQQPSPSAVTIVVICLHYYQLPGEVLPHR